MLYISPAYPLEIDPPHANRALTAIDYSSPALRLPTISVLCYIANQPCFNDNRDPEESTSATHTVLV